MFAVKVLILQAIVIRKEMLESYIPLGGDNVVALIAHYYRSSRIQNL